MLLTLPFLTTRRKPESPVLPDPPLDSLSVRSLMPLLGTRTMISLSLNVSVQDGILTSLKRDNPRVHALYEVLSQMGKLTHFSIYPDRMVFFFDKNISAREYTQIILETLQTVYGVNAFMVG
ncbi:MAG: hypothetical protein V4697_02885 [Patescibacteria group bacterium]